MRSLMLAAATAAVVVATAGAAQAQMFIPNPHAYRSDGQFTLAGARAGVTVLGVDIGASANLKVGLHDRYRGGGAVYAPPPPAYAQPSYASGYDGGGYEGGGYGGGGYSGGGYAYGERHATGYIPAPQPYYPPAPPCGCGY